MRFNLLVSLVLALAIPACGGGGDDGGDDTTGDDTADDSGDDSSAQPDAPPSEATVVSVTCPADDGEDALVTTSGFMFDPQTTNITVNQIVKFAPGSGHNAVSTTAGEDFGVDFDQVGCFQFTAVGSFTFKCEPHSFTGTVVVE